jgi:molecular chaperone GrpE
MHTARPLPQKYPFQIMARADDETPSDADDSEMDDLSPPTQEEAGDVAATDPVAELKAEVEKWKDLALRNAAELDNFRKRSSREMQDARAYANADLLRGLLPILDTFEMGLEAARAESEKSVVFQGLKMVQGMFGNYLREFGVEEVPAEGHTFDPNLHEALSTEASDTVPDHKVLRVQRRGYKLKDRLLRPANVVVSSGASATAEGA